ASASIYGTNASNGVVLITTKTGAGRPHVEYGGSFSSSSVTRLTSMLTAAQFRTAVTQHDSTALPQLGNANTDWFSLVDRTAMGQPQPISDTSSTGLMSPFGPVPSTGYYNWPGNSLTSPDNPLEVLNTAIDHATTYRSVGNVTAKYDFSQLTSLSGLTGTVDLG